MKVDMHCRVIAEGKTKSISTTPFFPGSVVVRSKDDITKNDDPDQTKILCRKAEYSTATTCAVFEFLEQCGIPVAFERRLSETEFLAPHCSMVNLEVIVRAFGVGSYLNRFPALRQKNGDPPFRFLFLVFELFLKTTGGKIVDKNGACIGNTPLDAVTKRALDDPFIKNPRERVWNLYHPKLPHKHPLASLGISLDSRCILPDGIRVPEIESLARKIFLLLEAAWWKLGIRLLDIKFEFGIDRSGKLLLADVVDNDNWRLRTSSWRELSKQLFRDNASVEEISDAYALVARLAQILGQSRPTTLPA